MAEGARARFESAIARGGDRDRRAGRRQRREAGRSDVRGRRRRARASTSGVSRGPAIAGANKRSSAEAVLQLLLERAEAARHRPRVDRRLGPPSGPDSRQPALLERSGRASGSTSSAPPGQARARPPSLPTMPGRWRAAAIRAARRRTRRRSRRRGCRSPGSTIRPTSPRERARTGSRSPRRSPRSPRITRSSWPRGEQAFRSSRGSRSSPTRRPAGRSSASRGPMARARPRAGWSTSWSRPALDPSAFVGALLPANLTGGIAGDRPLGEGSAVRRRGRRVRRQLRRLPPGHRDRHLCRMGPSRRVRRSGGGRRAFDAWLRLAADEAVGGEPPTLIANVADDGVAELATRPAGLARSRSWRPRCSRRRHSASRASGAAWPSEFRSGLGPATVVLGRVAAAAPDDDDARDPWPRCPARRRRPVRLPTAGPAQCRERARAWRRPPWQQAVGADAIAAGLASFPGVGRRLERKGDAGGVTVYDDYGHHPTAIRETLAAVRQREPGRRVWAVYEPLTYHRTAALLEAFADCAGRGRRASRSPRSGPAAIPTRPSRRRLALPRRSASAGPA